MKGFHKNPVFMRAEYDDENQCLTLDVKADGKVMSIKVPATSFLMLDLQMEEAWKDYSICATKGEKCARKQEYVQMNGDS